jgi:hypothetical protein
MARSVTKQLLCPVCGTILATAVHRRWPGRLALTSLSGADLPPESVALQLSRARSRVATDPDDEEAADRLAFLERHLAELVFDLRCRNGHSTLRTMPQLVRAMRNTAGEWVDLSR